VSFKPLGREIAGKGCEVVIADPDGDRAEEAALSIIPEERPGRFPER
jgi:hypothetical protein